MDFELTSQFQPTGDQPQAIDKLVSSIEHGDKAQVLLGVTGSGKTFTIANTIARLKRPALILSHNKTLAAQLFGEFKQFFPHNAVEYYLYRKRPFHQRGNRKAPPQCFGEPPFRTA